MMDRVERRQFERYILTGKTIAAFRHKNGRVKIGAIKNICKAGLLFEYNDFMETKAGNMGTIDIYIEKPQSYLPDIPCKIIYSHESSYDYYSIGMPVPIVNCGAQFVDLTPMKSNLIASVIDKLETIR